MKASAMRDQIAWLRRRLFGSTSDKRASRPADAGEGGGIIQMTLFDDEYLKAYEEAKAKADEEAEAILKEDERRQKAYPILEALDKWMEMVQSSVKPKSLLGKAIAYAYKMMPRLKRYCMDGRYRIDNNDCEQGNRTPVLGRKNYLFSANDKYAQDNAVFYSLI